MSYKYIRTYTGKEFYPMDPKPDAIDIRDIAHALSMVCRGNGHVNRFFSVAQHCIRCALEAEARELPQRMILACLIHDAGEAYMSDVPRPFKQFLGEYLAREEKLMEVVYGKFLGSPLTEEEQQILKQIDDDMLYFDLRDLLDEPQDRPEPEVHVDTGYGFVPFEEVEKQFLDLYEKWKVL